MSMCEVHDCFSITEMVTMEDLHISPKGGAYEDVMGGFYDLNGQVPCQVDGGLKCFGHPIGASGARILISLIYEMIKRDVNLGLATLCIGGGMGAAMVAQR